MRLIGAICAVAIALLVVGSAGSLGTGTGNFLLTCGYDHTASDDPIKYPGQPGMSHSHDFAGAVGVTASSTLPDLVVGSSLCNPVGDRSAYWVPTIVKPDGSLVHFTTMSVYYRANGATSLYPFPLGLKHIQGDPMNHWPGTYYMTYRCNGGGTFNATIPASCPDASGFTGSLYFGQCWDGVSLDNAAHKTLGACGPGFPLRVPQVNYLVHWPDAAVGGALSSDSMAGNLPGHPGYSGHGDFFNGWDPHLQDEIIQRCLLADIACRVRDNGDIYNFATQAVVIAEGE